MVCVTYCRCTAKFLKYYYLLHTYVFRIHMRIFADLLEMSRKYIVNENCFHVKNFSRQLTSAICSDSDVDGLRSKKAPVDAIILNLALRASTSNCAFCCTVRYCICQSKFSISKVTNQCSCTLIVADSADSNWITSFTITTV